MRWLVAMLVLVAACEGGRARDDAMPAAPTWRGEVEAIMSEHCVSCHAGVTPAGAYDLSTYLGALGDGSDRVANAIAGDEGSVILAVLEAGGDHLAFIGELPVLRAWVVDGRLGYFDSPLHEPGLLDRSSAEFHGKELAARAWDLALCQGCHGDDFGGGTSGASCLDCHQEAPTDCATCHAASPTTGPHRAHLEQGVACAECHRVPTRWDDPGHVATDGVGDPPPAEVRFGPIAGADLDPPRRTGPPTFDPVSGTCSNVFCHGFADPAARVPSPVWTVDGAQATCGACHGLPPADHLAVPPDDCTACHSRAPADHVDGVVELGDGAGGCDACHGDATSAGAHRSHLDGSSGLRGPMACADCHVVPATLGAPGHLDADLIAEVVMATSAWDRDTATCTGACHGAATPVWTRVGVGEAACGTCHGVPPADASHDPALTVFDCTGCHPAFDQDQHMDGDVDL